MYSPVRNAIPCFTSALFRVTLWTEGWKSENGSVRFRLFVYCIVSWIQENAVENGRIKKDWKKGADMRLGEFQEMTVLYEKDFGVFLGQEGEEKGVLLPKRQVPAGTKVGDKLEVFLYKDSDDRVIATTQRPLITMGELARLTVAQKTPIGAFLKWGLAKDLLLPFKEQTGSFAPGDQLLVKLYLDKSERLCATMRIGQDLVPATNFAVNDVVTGYVYRIHPEIGVFVAVEGKYPGLIPAQNVTRTYRMGEEVKARIIRVRTDGKLDLGTERPAYLQMQEDAKHVRAVIESFDGELPFGEKASAELIHRELGLSKAAFKRAISQLLKERAVVCEENAIRLVKRSGADGEE